MAKLLANCSTYWKRCCNLFHHFCHCSRNIHRSSRCDSRSVHCYTRTGSCCNSILQQNSVFLTPHCLVEVDLPLQPTASDKKGQANYPAHFLGSYSRSKINCSCNGFITGGTTGALAFRLHQPTQTLIRALHTFLVSGYNPSSTQTMAANLDTNENISIVIITKCGWLYNL